MDFNPSTQNITFLAPDGTTPIQIPLAAVDAWYDESVSITMNFGAQLGLSILMLLTILALTPTDKFRRPTTALQFTALLVSIVRSTLEFVYMREPYNHLYVYFTNDTSHVDWDLAITSVVANTSSFVLVILIEIMLMIQAWTMVAFWHKSIKYSIAALSMIITLLTIASRFAITIVQNKSILSYKPAYYFYWGYEWALVMNAISIFWFCAVFNAKLVFHIVSNRGILPSRALLNPMEVLIMANGLLMIFPAIFAGLEWGHFTNFESASLTTTSVIVILPLGALAAQRISQSKSEAYLSSTTGTSGNGQGFQFASSNAQYKTGGTSSFSNGSTATRQTVPSRTESSALHSCGKRDPIDLELSQIDNFGEHIESRDAARYGSWSRDSLV